MERSNRDKSGGQAEAAEEKSTWTKIIDGVQTVVKFVCVFKENIKDLLSGKVKGYLRRHKYRMFISMSRYRKSLWFWDTLVDKVKNMWGSVEEMVKKKWDQVKAFGKELFDALQVIWKSIVSRITGSLGGDFVEKLKVAFNCVVGLGNVVSGIVSVIKKTVDRIADIIKIAAGDAVALASVIVDLICNFADFREAINKFIDGIHESDTMKKYNDFGQFAGILFKALMARRRRHYKLQ